MEGKELQQIRTERLNQVSTVLNEEFDGLLDIEEQGMKFSEKYCENEYIESDDHRSNVVVQDKRGARKQIGRNVNKKQVVKYRLDGAGRR